MPKIALESLLTLEAYSRERKELRARILLHKKARKVNLNDNIILIFEDEMTVRYQIQEILRVERIFEEERIRDELDAYNPLVPDGRNFKATMMLEYPDPEERRLWLECLIGVEDKVWIQVEGCKRVWAVADEDLDRENEQKTSAVHFLRFEVSDEMVAALRYGMAISFGIDHAQCSVSIESPPDTRDALIKDLA